MNTSTVVVEAVAGSAKSFKGNGTWFKRGKNAKFGDFSLLRKGQELIITHQGEWVSDFTTTGNTSNATQTSNSSSLGLSNNRTSNNNNTNGDLISRQSAVKSVLGSPVVAELLRSTELTSEKQALDIVDSLITKYYTYITTGSFATSSVTTPAEVLKEVVNA